MATYLINHLRIPGDVPNNESLTYLESGRGDRFVPWRQMARSMAGRCHGQTSKPSHVCLALPRVLPST
jgi:hypothetical protein